MISKHKSEALENRRVVAMIISKVNKDKKKMSFSLCKEIRDMIVAFTLFKIFIFFPKIPVKIVDFFG